MKKYAPIIAVSIIIIVIMAVVFAVRNPKAEAPADQAVQTNVQKDSIVIGPHEQHHNQYAHFHLSTEAQWDSLNGVVHTHNIQAPGYTLTNEYRTFGWHMYSNGSAWKKYNFDLLWGLSYFNYEIIPSTGEYKSIHSWKTTAMIDSAQAHNCKVFLTATCFGASSNETFLSSEKAQDTFIDNLISLLKLRNADGVNLDFEGLPSSQRTPYVDFISKLHAKMLAANPDFQISITLYAVDWNHVFDIKSLNKYVDFYTLMAYDYYGSFSKHKTGPVSPLSASSTWGKSCVESSVDFYLAEGVKPKDLIVGLPYYGANWLTATNSIPSQPVLYTTPVPTYASITKYYDGYASIYDTICGGSYKSFSAGGKPHQIWYEDVTALSKKYDWIKKKGLSGAAVWALGYDDGYDHLWKLMGNKFGKVD